jgi:hypothetical protein
MEEEEAGEQEEEEEEEEEEEVGLEVGTAGRSWGELRCL